MTRSFALGTFLVVSSASCSVPLLANQASQGATNQCSSDSDCGPHGACVGPASGASGGMVCASRSGAFDSIMLEVLPDSSDPIAGGLSFLLPEDGLAEGAQRDIALPSVTGVVGKVIVGQGATSPETGCPYDTAPDGSILAHVQFSRTSSILGIAPADYATNTTLNTAPAKGYAFNLPVVPDVYDIYVVPTADSACPISPLLQTGIPVDATNDSFTFDLNALAPRLLSGTIKSAAGTTLAGWTIDMVEPSQGRVISTSGALGPSAPNAPTNFSIAYRPVQAPPTANPTHDTTTGGALPSDVPFIRVTPPKGQTAPTVFWSLAVDLDGDGRVGLNLSGAAPVAHVQGQVLSSSDGSPIPAAVTFSSTALQGATLSGLTESYSTTVRTETGDGNFKTDLISGTYRVVAVPDPGTPWGITEATWVVDGSGVTDSSTLMVDLKANLSGTASAPSAGAPIVGASVQLVSAVAPSTVGVLAGVLAQDPALPRTGSTLTDPSGAFQVALDNGDYHLFIRPTDRASFPWYVVPHVQVPRVGNPIDAPIALPVVVEGKVSAIVNSMQARAEGNATLRAYASLPGESGMIEVAEGRTDDNGFYRLLLPPGFGP